VDYPGGRLGLSPNARFDAPFDYDRTGLLLQYAGDHYVVGEVAEASPAAGLLAAGDRVVAIDGKAAAEVPPPAWARLRSQPAGTALKFTVERGGGPPEELTITLLELL
jgi:C-terminal processing protease CtpA/Prc